MKNFVTIPFILHAKFIWGEIMYSPFLNKKILCRNTSVYFGKCLFSWLNIPNEIKRIGDIKYSAYKLFHFASDLFDTFVSILP